MREFASMSVPPWATRLWAELGLALGCGVVLAMLGPFGTFERAALSRTGYWVALCGLWFILVAIVDLIVDMLPRYRSAPAGYRLLLKIAIAALPMLAAVVPATYALQAFQGNPFRADCIVYLYPKVLLVGAGLSAVSAALFDGAFTSWQRASHADPLIRQWMPADRTAFDRDVEDRRILDRPEDSTDSVSHRLWKAACGPVLCLEMEDHYVRVHGSERSALILMRMSDAVASMGEASGLRVHRSWWVARDAVKALARDGRRLKLHLANGVTVPVSQSYRAMAVAQFGGN